jgi:hypothetical protein
MDLIVGSGDTIQGLVDTTSLAWPQPGRSATGRPGDGCMNLWTGKVDRWLQSSPAQEAVEGSGFFRGSNDPSSVLAAGQDFLEWLRSSPEVLKDLPSQADPQAAAIRSRFAVLCRTFGGALQRACLDTLDDSARPAGEPSLAAHLASLASQLYQALHPYAVAEGEGWLLQTVAWPRTRAALSELAELLVRYPPHDWTAAAMGLSPLMRSSAWPIEALFPRVLEAIHQPATAAPVLDLANYCVHQRLVGSHPVKLAPDTVALEDSLTQMLGGVVARLGLLEEDPTKFGGSPEKIQRVLGDAIALCVALCDAVGLLRHEPAIGKLHQALALRHRRVQAEAAAALARMNQEYGQTKLIELAAEPIARLRVLAYAEELGIGDQIDLKYQEPEAIAEAELALWLTQPQQLGMPPSSMELIDHRVLFWPSYDRPQDCFLFRFQYPWSHGTWSNVGMAGPLVHAFGADLADLPMNDIYAAFAGWQAEHPEIYELPPEQWNISQRRVVEQFVRALEDHGHHQIQPLWLGFFLGEVCLVAETQVNQRAGVAVSDGLETIWYPAVGRQRPLGPREAYAIFKGRKMLRTFNPNFDNELDDERDA